MHINLERDSQILDFNELKWFLPCLLFTFLLPDWKDNKGKQTPCELVGTPIYGLTDFLDQHWNACKRGYLFWCILRAIYKETSGSKLEKKCCLIRNLTYSLEWAAMRKVCKLVRKEKKVLEYMLIFQAGRQTSTSRSGWGEYFIIFWAGGSSVTQQPFTSPCSAAMLLP